MVKRDFSSLVSLIFVFEGNKRDIIMHNSKYPQYLPFSFAYTIFQITFKDKLLYSLAEKPRIGVFMLIALSYRVQFRLKVRFFFTNLETVGTGRTASSGD